MPGKPAPPSRSPEREALAAAIERQGNAVRNADATRRALSETRSRLSTAADAVTTAKAAIEIAKANTVADLTAMALGEAGKAPVTIKAARAELQAAEDDLEAQRAVQATLETRVAGCENELERSARQLTERIRDVVRSEPEIRNLMTKFVAVKKDLDQRRRDLQWLDNQFMIPDEFKNWDLEEFSHRPEPNDLTAGTAPWAASIAELASEFRSEVAGGLTNGARERKPAACPRVQSARRGHWVRCREINNDPESVRARSCPAVGRSAAACVDAPAAAAHFSSVHDRDRPKL